MSETLKKNQESRIMDKKIKLLKNFKKDVIQHSKFNTYTSSKSIVTLEVVGCA